jgi:hypothetical protein
MGRAHSPPFWATLRQSRPAPLEIARFPSGILLASSLRLESARTDSTRAEARHPPVENTARVAQAAMIRHRRVHADPVAAAPCQVELG